MKIIEEHEGTKESDVDADEERIIRGALSYSDKNVGSIMTPRTMVYALEIDQLLDKKTLNKIKKEGFTRIPIYEETLDNIIGILYAKDLINLPLKTKVKDVYRRDKVLVVSQILKLDELLDMLIKSKTHLACVKNEYSEFEGVVALEDILEEILKLEIVDETDQIIDLREEARKRAKK